MEDAEIKFNLLTKLTFSVHAIFKLSISILHQDLLFHRVSKKQSVEKRRPKRDNGTCMVYVLEK